MSRSSESESSTMRRGFTRSKALTRSSAKRFTSTSVGWKSVPRAPVVNISSTCDSSMISMPSSDQRCDSATASSSSRVSESVT